MSRKMIQEKCGLREKQWKFERGELRLLDAALDLWCQLNGFQTGRSMGEMIGADFAKRHGGRAGR